MSASFSSPWWNIKKPVDTLSTSKHESREMFLPFRVLIYNWVAQSSLWHHQGPTVTRLCQKNLNNRIKRKHVRPNKLKLPLKIVNGKAKEQKRRALVGQRLIQNINMIDF